MTNAIPTKIDWKLYLERQQSLFLWASFINPYGEYLQEATGFSFKHQLYWFEGEKGTSYRSAKEMKTADLHYLRLVRQNDPKLKEWSQEGVNHNNRADGVIKRFNDQVSTDEIVEEYQEIQKQTEKIMLYGTVIPYRILSSINYAIENEGAQQGDFQEILDLFEPLRAVTRYPQIVETIYRAFWRAAAKVTNTDTEEVFALTTPPELAEVFSTKVIDHATIAQRKQGCALWLDEDGKSIQVSYDKNYLQSVGMRRLVTKDITEFKGSVANKGIIRGTVRIVNTIEDARDFQDGDIVVSINTNPSLMPVLIRCGGIVTDEGGIMCHAAIVSRELNKPCVIGTKVATKVLKNGNTVEVDANNGIVKIVS